MSGISGVGSIDGAARLRQSIQERLKKGQQEQTGRFVDAAIAAGAANPGGVRFGDDRRVVKMGAGAVDGSGEASGSANPAGVARARHHDEAGEVERHGEAHEVEGHDEDSEDEQGEHRLGHLEVAVRAPGEVADPAGVAQATAARGTAAYRRTAAATEPGAASPGISVAA